MKSEVSDESYIKNLPVVRALYKMGKFMFNKHVTFFVGENGSGKNNIYEY